MSTVHPRDSCLCGLPIATIEVDTGRAITDLRTGLTEVPVTRRCDDGHATTEYVSKDTAMMALATGSL